MVKPHKILLVIDNDLKKMLDEICKIDYRNQQTAIRKAIEVYYERLRQDDKS